MTSNSLINIFKHLVLISLVGISLVSCSSDPSATAKTVEIESAAVWDGYDPKRLDHCRLRPQGGVVGRAIIKNCSSTEMSEIKETYKGKYIVFQGFSTSFYDNKLNALESGGYVYKNVEIPNLTEHTEFLMKVPPVRWYRIKNLYVWDPRMVDFLFNEDNKDTGNWRNPKVVPEPLAVLTFKGLIDEVNPRDDYEKSQYIERRVTVIEEAIIIDPTFYKK